jgi:RNA polymerase sigma factor (sigma-70 family)
MSTKRQRQPNEESFEALQAFIIEIAEGDPELINSDAVWRRVVSDLWFCAEVRRQASQLVGGDLGDPAYDDMVQQIVLQLQAKLSKHLDLGAEIEQIRTDFPGWMARIIHNACVDTLRRERRHPPHPPSESEPVRDPVPQEDLRLDMAEVISALPPREQDVAHCKLHNMSLHETAERLKLTDKQVRGSLKKVFEFLRRKLGVYWYG